MATPSAPRPLEILYRYDPARPVTSTRPATAAQAQRLLERGNREFASLLDQATGKVRATTRILPLDLRDLGAGSVMGRAPEQAPFAAVLGCADARVPVELVLQRGSNDLFVVRVAGNVLGNECLGSLRYAVHQFARTLRLVVVLGHAHCGAVSAAVDAFLVPEHYLPLASNTPLRSILDRILVCVRGAALALERGHGRRVERRRGYRAALVEVSVAINAAWTAYNVQQELRGHGPRPVAVAFGVYDLVSRQVRLPLSPPRALTRAEIGLFPPPAGAVAFQHLTRRLARGRLVRELLGG